MVDQFIQEAVQFINTLPPLSIYLVFFMVAYVENIVPPIPGDVLVAFGGYLAAESVIGLVPILLLTTIASVIGFMSMYWIGSRWGRLIQQKKKQFWLLRFIPLKYINKVRSWMQRWGMGVILANRFLAGTRSVISLTAGLSHTHISGTIIYSTISSLLWNGILLGFGWIVHENWQLIGKYLSIYGRIILAGIAIFIIIKLIVYYYNKRSPN
ncbi:DedA family protein [Aliifodinibius salipaludis]|uniref:DedA family protein n=1 Tax=Fodinibius salipaludis TaxID=2032627 RepID=A0A2A2GB24_9BACT|nr:DedA family protein [Aliifodinibius salipaludis]PAU94063.1 DedA family protein [Aliifodinibius salipaludis]